ncbi:MAG: hypothetical protein L3J35_12595 [Bacteroidales bacterium]|nr:hypothetical protein [Bacteroidales bacterium]
MIFVFPITSTYSKVYIAFLLIFFLFSDNLSYSQSNIDSVDLTKVLQKRKKKFIKNKYLKNIVSFNELFPKCYNEKDSSKYTIQNDIYFIDENINTVWDQYKNISLKESYSGHLVKFGFLYSKPENKLIYVNDEYSGLKEGQIIFIRLDLLKGIKKLVVAYEVANVDDENKIIQFCYMNNGVSEGSQKIMLSEAENGQTKITHRTFFKSDSKFRDKRIYPGFHRRVVSELHHNLMNSFH